MSFCTYIASDLPLAESELLWPLSRGGEDIYTEKQYVVQVEPDLEDMAQVLAYIQKQMEETDELEVWHIWQGVEYKPVIRSENILLRDLKTEDLEELVHRDVFATATQYDIPVQYRIVVQKGAR